MSTIYKKVNLTGSPSKYLPGETQSAIALLVLLVWPDYLLATLHGCCMLNEAWVGFEQDVAAV
jgi:hypothetical protein